MMMIHESEYGDSPLNFHVHKVDSELRVELTYPPWSDAENVNNQCRYICVDQESVRASDGIRLHYDYARDGFVVEQPRPYMTITDETNCYDSKIDWIEVGFFPSWKFHRELDEQFAEADNASKPVK